MEKNLIFKEKILFNSFCGKFRLTPKLSGFQIFNDATLIMTF